MSSPPTPIPTEADRPFLEVVNTQRSVRRFRPDPVPEALVRRVLGAAIKAPNGSNLQTWRFLAITDAAKRVRLGELYAASLARQRGQPLAEVMADANASRTRREAAHLALHFGEVPVHLVACDVRRPGLVYLPGSSIYPACQNLMLAAWALGLGTVLTTIWKHEEAAVRALLAIPDDYELWAVIPLGWPTRSYGPPQRLPFSEVAFHDTWGKPYT